MTLSELVVEYRNDHNLSQRQFAVRCGVSNGYIAMLEKNLNPKTGQPLVPTIPSLMKIASGMGMTLSDLFGSIEDMPVDLSFDDGKNFTTPAGLSAMPGLTLKPRLGTIACGEPILAEQNIEGYDTVPDYIKCDFTLLCRGDSMINARIYDGDIVCIRHQEEVENGQIAAVLIDGIGGGEATLKRVRYTDNGVILWPENPAYEPMTFFGEDAARVHILGLATHFISTIR